MQIISFGTDKNILNKNSRAHARLLEYTKYFEKYYCVVVCDKDFHIENIKQNNLQIITINKKNIMGDILKLSQYLHHENLSKEKAFISSQDAFDIGLISYYLSQKLDLNLHIQIHTDIFSKYFIFENARTIVQKIISTFVIRKANSIRVVSHSLKDNVIKNYNISKQDIFVAPIIPELKENISTREKSKDTFKILMISRLVPVKNLENAVLAFIDFAKDKNVKLEIVGDGPLRNSLEKIILKHKAGDTVSLLGHRENVQDYYQSADLFLHTSTYEGFGSVIYEALFYNLPIVATPFGGALDFIKDSDNLIIAKDFNNTSIAAALEQAYTKFKDKKINTSQDLENFNKQESLQNQVASWQRAIQTKYKLLYILPEISDTTHMKYNAEFVQNLAHNHNADIFLIIERGNLDKEKIKILKEKLGVKYLKYTDNKNTILRIARLIYFILSARWHGYDKVYVHYSFVGAIAASLFGFGATVYYWNCGLPFNYKRKSWQEMYERFAYRVIDRFVTGGHSLAVKYAKHYGFDVSKIVVVPNWIDVAETQEKLKVLDKNKIKKDLNISEDKKVLLFNQRHTERKGAHYIVPILQNIPNDTVMIVTNDGPYREKLEKEISENNLQSKVILLGKVNHERILELLKITDVYALPSEEEGMSHSLMEAMVAGVASIAFDVGSTDELFGENAKEYLVENKNIDTCIAKLNQLLANSQKRDGLAQSLLENIRRFDKEKVAKVFLSEI